MKIQNTFTDGIIEKDLDERLVPHTKLIDSENFYVNTTQGSNAGVGKNVLGNFKKSNFNIHHSFQGAKTIGSGKNSSKNKVYNFIKADFYDFIIEYDTISELSQIVLQSTTGTRLNFKEGERILNVDTVVDSNGNGDLLKWSGDSNPPRIGNVERMKTWGIDGFTAEEIMLIKAPPLYPVGLEPLISTENALANNLENKFLSFAYRYKYKDGYYSAISTWTEYFFYPKIYNLSFDTFENLGMLNIYNAVNISFDTGDREVIGIDLLFKLSNEFTPYIIEKFIKKDKNWADNTIQTFEFNNSKIYSILPESEYYRNFDNIPHSAVCGTLMGNRATFANYLENYDLIDKNGNPILMSYITDFISNNFINYSLNRTDEDVTYNFGEGYYNLTNGKIQIDCSAISLIKGSLISIKFRLKSNVFSLTSLGFTREVQFNDEFLYILTDTYSNLTDLIANSTIVNQLNNIFTSKFTTNGGVVFPNDYLAPYVIKKGFELTSVGDFMEITFPVIKYEITSTPNYFITDYFYDSATTASYENIGIKTSMKSFRSYEICMIYRDKQGRKTTALISDKNTVFIDNTHSITQNKIRVSIPLIQKPPVWATTYKFGLKLSTENYETIPINIFFIDGIYRWIKLDGENKNKVKDGDILLVKRDSQNPLSNLIKVKVLERSHKDSNFISTNADYIIEPSGEYAKIKATNFEMQYQTNEFVHYQYDRATHDDQPYSFLGDFTITKNGITEDREFQQGSTIHIRFSSNTGGNAPYLVYDKIYTANQYYKNFKEFYDTQISPDEFISSDPDKQYEVQLIRGIPDRNPDAPNLINFITPDSSGFLWLQIKGLSSAHSTQRGFLDAYMDIRYVSGFYIFETTVKENFKKTFYETPEVYTITNGNHQMIDHILDKTYNCFCQGNGVESFQIRDAFNEKELAIDFCPTAISDDGYKQIRRFADITYSGVYNSNTNINKLNEFNASLANFKDDIDKSFGAIYKIKAKDTNLEVCQENKDSIIYYGKDLLYNADGTTNLARIELVLGQQKTYDGEFGISTNSESYDLYGFNSYHTDVKRGVVLKKSNNGLFEISSQGMRDYFKTLFKNNIITQIIGKYDQFYDVYILNIKYNNNQFVTWVYSDRDNGWYGRVTFNPEDMIRINGLLFSFKNGEIYQHNIVGNNNTFYGVESPSKFSFNFSQNPSDRKNFKTIEIEGTTPVEVILKTDYDNGYIHKDDFERKEGVFYAYVRNSNGTIDTSMLSCQGIGNCAINGLNLEFSFDLDSIISIGDEIRNSNLELVGIVLEKSINSVTLDSVNNLLNGDFVLCSKPQSIENQDLLGYYMKVDCEFSSINAEEVYAVNSEISKSYS